jgi:hypothetical protein
MQPPDPAMLPCGSMHACTLQLRSSPERVSETLAFLRQDLGFKQEEIGPLVVKFPNVLSYGVQASWISRIAGTFLSVLVPHAQHLHTLISVSPPPCNPQAHLKPHLAYLASLGEQDVRGLILQRPHVLGEGFEKVIKFLQLCRVPRKEIYRMLRSYPLDYCLKLKAPAALAEIEASSSPGAPEEGAGGGAENGPEKST